MKYCFLFSFFFVSLFDATAQMQSGFHYKIKDSILRYSDGTPGGRPKYIRRHPGRWNIGSSENLKADLTVSDSGRIKVEFWGILPDSDPDRRSLTYVNSQDNVDSFYLEIEQRHRLGDITKYLSIPFVAWEVGALTIPYKYWAGNSQKNISNNTVTDFNVGLYAGRKWGRKRFYRDTDKNHESGAFTLAAFLAPTKIELTEDNVIDTSGFKESSELGFSLGIGAMYSYRRINLGIFTGSDLSTSAEGQNWKYEKRMWIGFGFGYQLKMFSE